MDIGRGDSIDIIHHDRRGNGGLGYGLVPYDNFDYCGLVLSGGDCAGVTNCGEARLVIRL